MLNKVLHTRFFIKILHWEYWSFHIIYFPLYLYWLILSIRAKSLLFFSAVNPGILSGGLLGESKIKLLDMLADEIKPITFFFSADTSFKAVLLKLEKAKITYPIIAKPNVGERGLLVEKICNETELISYLNKIKVDFLIQEFIDFAEEYAILYHRFPDAKYGEITSITHKKFLSVTGDGEASIKELIFKNPRAKLKSKRLINQNKRVLNKVLNKNEEFLLMPIGNHCNGTTFLNANHLISEELNRVFDKFMDQLKDIQYCRFDFKCTSGSDLINGKNIKIMEINGVGAEPAHIYDPSFRLVNAWAEIFKHWNIIYKISQVNRKKGHKFMSLKEGIHTVVALNSYYKLTK